MRATIGPSAGSSTAPSVDAQDAHEDDTTARGLIQRAIARRRIQRKAEREAAAGSLSIPDGKGDALDDVTRARHAPHAGDAVGKARIHTGAASAAAAAQLGARAFTVGDDIHFGAGEWRPGTKEGDHLLAHELTHVADGAEGISRKTDGKSGDASVGVSHPHDAAEQRADAKADQATSALHAPPQVDETGILTHAATVKLDGKETPLDAGTVVKVTAVDGPKLKVRVLSGHNGEAEIERTLFSKQPGVGMNPITRQPRGDVYADFSGTPLWDEAGPKPDDVRQGFIGDCFLMSALQSVCASNPAQIKSLISPQQPGAKQYTVTLYKRDPQTDQLVPTSTVIDAMLPALNPKAPEPNGPAPKGSAPELAYAGRQQDASEAKLWPSLIEKAYATSVGGYGKLGEGGPATDSLEALTGKPSEITRSATGNDAIAQKLKQHEQRREPVVCSSRGVMMHAQEKAFRPAGPSKVAGKLTAKDGGPCQVMRGTIEISDESKKISNIADDAHGGFVGEHLSFGTIDYGTGDTKLLFKPDKAPEDPQTLVATFDYHGLISTEYHLFGGHGYTFVKIEGEQVILKNPYGFADPNPIPLARFGEFFEAITAGTAPDSNAARSK